MSCAVYLHLPFCIRRCRYCDFFSTAGMRDQIPAYLAALESEIRLVGTAGGQPKAVSVYFGGGTPSLLRPQQVSGILGTIRQSFIVPDGIEITLEANPGTAERARWSGYRKAGVNRLSLGMQSADDTELRLLGRVHTFAETIQSCKDARRAGMENISLDLIFGLPGQTTAVWERTLHHALELAPEHLSLYALTLERGNELAREIRRGALPAPDEYAAADMYELAEEQLAAAGYSQYEISNWARGAGSGKPDPFPQYASRHNLQYWLNLPYLGFGAGAHGCAGGRRIANIRSVEKYTARMRSGRIRRFPLGPANTSNQVRSREEEIRETMWLGLRLTERGVVRTEFRERFGEDFSSRFRDEIEELKSTRLLEWAEDGERLRLTKRGRLLGNQVFLKFV